MSKANRNYQSNLAQKVNSYREINMLKSFADHTSPYPNNRISSSEYNYVTLIPKTLLYEFYNLSYIWFSVLIIIELTSSLHKPSMNLSTLVGFISILILSVGQNLTNMLKRNRIDEEINNKQVSVWRKIEFVSEKSQNLRVGNIILLRKKEVVPADIIILACSGGKSAKVTMKNIIGNNELYEKHSIKDCSLQRDFDLAEIFQMLKRIENVKVSVPSRSFNNFSAKLKFKGNPKIQTAGVENFIVGGSKIIGNDWVIGLVVYTGMETKVWFNSKRSFSGKLSKLGVLINKIQLVNFVIMIIIVFISVVLDRTCNKEAEKYTITDSIIWYLILYGNTVSLSLVISIKLSKNISAFLLKKKIRGLSINPEIVQELGKVEYILTGKSGIVADENLKVTNVLIKDCLYSKEKHFKPEKISNRHEIVECSSPSKLNNFRFSSFTELEEIIESQIISESNSDFFRTVAICCQGLDVNSEKYISAIDKAIKKTFEKKGIKAAREYNRLNINYGETEEDYEILGERFKINTSQVVVRCERTDKVFIFYKGDFGKVSDLLDSESNYFCSEEIAKSKILLGLRAVIFAYKELNFEEVNIFINKLKIAKLSPIHVERRLKSVFNKACKNLIFTGVVGLEYYVSEKTRTSIALLNNIGIKTWMISGDSIENTLVACYSSGIFNTQTKLFSLADSSSPWEILQRMKKLMKSISSTQKSEATYNNTGNAEFNQIISFGNNELPTLYKNHNKSVLDQHINIKRYPTINALIPDQNKERKLSILQLPDTDITDFFLLIDAENLQLALSSEDHRKNFTMLLFTAKSVCFCGLTPDQKVDIVRLLKNNFTFCPTVLAVGDGQTNAGMLDEAFISVLIEKPNKIKANFSPDLLIEKFSSLSSLIMIHGHYSYIRLSKVLLYSIYKETMICTLLFLYQFNSGFSGSILLDFDLLVLYEMLISIIPMVFTGVFEKDVQEKDAMQSSEVYRIGYFNILMNYKNICFYYFIGVLQGIILHFFINFSLGDIANSDGKTEDFEVKGVLCFILISLLLLQKIYINTSSFSLPALISPLVTIGCLVLLIYFIYLREIADYQVTQGIILGQTVFWISVTTLPSIFTAFYYIASGVFYRLADLRLRNRLEMFKDNIQAIFKDTQNWSQVSNSDSLDINAKTLVFNSEFIEQEYQKLLTYNSRRFLQFFIALVTFFCFLYSILLYGNIIPQLKFSEYAIIPGIISLIFVVASFFKKIQFRKLIFLYCVFVLMILLTNSLINQSYTITRYPAIEVFFSICVHFRLHITGIQILLSFIVSIVVISIEAKTFDPSALTIITLTCVVLNLGISVLCIIVTYLIDRSKRNEFVIVKKSKIGLEKANTILSYLLPEFVKKRVKDGIRYIAEDKGIVSILFCDIGDFDQILTHYSPQELTSFLDDVFGRFDKICENSGVTKIETVGKTYLACAGLKDSDRDMSASLQQLTHARRAIEMGFALIEESEKIFLKDGQHLKLKIGINTGPVTAGVVGYHKPQFSLVGDTVNTASRMASTLDEYNSIQISLDTFEDIGDKYGLDFSERNIDVKGKGVMNTMIVKPQLTEYIFRNFKDLGSNTEYSEYSQSIIKIPSLNDSAPDIKHQTYKTEEYYIKQKKQISWRYKVFSLLCIETEVEKEFQDTLIQHGLLLQFAGLLVSAVCNLFLIIINVVQFTMEMKYRSKEKLIFLTIEEFFTVFMLFIIKRINKSKWCAYLLNTLYFVESVFIFALNFQGEYSFITDMMHFYFRFLLMNFCTGLYFSKSLISNLAITLIWVMKTILFQLTIENIIFTVFFIACCLVITFLREQKLREDFLVKDIVSEEQEKTDQLLSQMMPSHVLYNLKQGISTTDKLNTVTVMYADIVGFTSWSSTKSSTDVVSMLSELFTNFDKNCVKHNVYKVHTIGDCYVAMGYIGDLHRNPAREAVNMINFALSLLEIIETTNKKCDCKLDMRIGMHTGAVIGGITGTNVVRYDIYGKDVQIANKMESNGLPGRIAISEYTKLLVEDYAPNEFKYEAFKEIEISKESMIMFLVSS